MKKSILVLTMIFLCSIKPILAEEVPFEKKALIDQLLTQTGQTTISVSKQFSTIFIQQMTMLLRQSQPDIDPKAYDYMSEEVISIFDDEIKINGGFFDLIYPIYNKHFSNQELEEIIAFNNTALGKKMNKVLPQITQEAMLAGQEFGKSLGPKIKGRVLARFEQEGIEIKKK